MCSTSFKRLLGRFETPLTITLSRIMHNYTSSLRRLKKTQQLLVLLSWVNLNGGMQGRAAPPPSLVRANVQLQGWHAVLEHEKTQQTLLPWQPSQRITVLQHITPPTTLAASGKMMLLFGLCCSGELLWSSWSGFLTPHSGDLTTSCERVAFSPH